MNQYEQEAYDRGKQAALAAASWTTDGNESDESRQRKLRMLADGDPQVWDYLPREPNLSGEYADDPTPTSLYRDITGRDESDPADGLAFETLHGRLIDRLADAFEQGVFDHFAAACEAELRGTTH